MQTPAAVHPVPAAQPVGQLTGPHEFVPQLAVHEQEVAQSTDAQALAPLQLTVHAPSAQPMLSHALLPAQVIWQVVAPVPQSMLPHALFAAQLTTQDAASLQSIDEHEPPLLHVMLQAYPAGQSTPLLHEAPGQLTLQVFATTSQPPLHSLGHTGFTQ